MQENYFFSVLTSISLYLISCINYTIRRSLELVQIPYQSSISGHIRFFSYYLSDIVFGIVQMLFIYIYTYSFHSNQIFSLDCLFLSCLEYYVFRTLRCVAFVLYCIDFWHRTVVRMGPSWKCTYLFYIRVGCSIFLMTHRTLRFDRMEIIQTHRT